MPRRAVVVALGALLALAACATPPRPFTEAFFEPLRVRRAAVPATPVAVFAFADARGEDDPAVVVRYEPRDARASVERATGPVGAGVARAFARGLAARGYTVTDATTRAFTPGDAAPAPLVVTGRVAEFGVRVTRSSLVTGWSSRAAVRVTVEVRDAAGRLLAERSYQRVTQGAMMPAEPLSILSQALAEVVEQAATDPALLPRA